MQGASVHSPSIAELASRSGRSVPCAGNRPVALDDPDSVWVVERGAVHLFLVESKDGVQQAAPQHLLRRETGELLFGVAPDAGGDGHDTTLSLVAKGSPGTLLKRLPASRLAGRYPADLAAKTDSWIIALTDRLSRFASHLPRPTALAEPGRTRTLEPCVLSVRRGVVWVSGPLSAAGLFMGLVDPAETVAAGGLTGTAIPLTRTAWFALFDEAAVSGEATETLAQQDRLLPALAGFHAMALALERHNRRLAVVDDANLERARTTSRRTAEQAARQRLFNIYDQPVDPEAGRAGSDLAGALRIIGRREGIDFRIPARSERSESPVSLVDILDASGVRARRVSFREAGSWWRGDSNAILAFRSEDGRPVALLPGSFGRYREIDPVSRRRVRVTAARARALGDEGWMFYRPLPPRPVKPSELPGIALRGSGADLARLFAAGLFGGLVKLLPALALGFVAQEVAAGGSPGAVQVAAAALAAFGLLGALLHLLQATAFMRLEGRAGSRVEAAFWDRLMRLPPGLLRRHPAGDLAMSGMTFQKLRDGLQGVVADSLLSAVFLLPMLGVIWFYDTTLGVVALAFSLASLLVTAVIGWRQIAPYGRMIRAARRVAGRLFQVIGGIAKLRVENAEGSAYAIWAGDYRDQKRAEIEVAALEGHGRAWGAALPLLAGGTLLAAVMTTGDRTLPVSDFLVVYGCDSHMDTFCSYNDLAKNHAASATCATCRFSLAQGGGFQPPPRPRRGTNAAQARSKRPDLRSDRKLRTPWPPSRPQRCPERFIRIVTSILLAASTAPEPTGKPAAAASA